MRSAEVYALMILFVCEHGYNASVVGSMTVGGGRADDRNIDDPVYLVSWTNPDGAPKQDSSRTHSLAVRRSYGRGLCR